MSDFLTKKSSRLSLTPISPHLLSSPKLPEKLLDDPLPKNPAPPQQVSPANSNSDGEDNDDDDNDNDNDFNSPIQEFLKATECNNVESLEEKVPQATEENSPSETAAQKNFSMKPDMIFGWKPKYVAQGPVPLRFFSPMLDEIVKMVHDQSGQNGEFPEVVYQGFRPENTFALHEKYSTSETYNLKLSAFLQAKHTLLEKVSNKTTINPPRPFLGMKQGVQQDCLVFDSIFEHGNLDTVIRKARNEYDMFVRVDSNTRGHTSWYYFTVKNMKKGQNVKFNILNLSKKDSLYQRGMKPYVHSAKLQQEKGIEWKQRGENVVHSQATINYLGEDFEELNQKKYYQVSFNYRFEYDNDVVSFALCVPYTYTRLLNFIQQTLDAQKDDQKEPFFTTSKLCNSLGGLNVPLITITDPDQSVIPLSKRPLIVCASRVHPGESNASWMIQGFIENLCKDTEEAKYLRSRFLFKIVPMLNPDGVVLGNHRTGFCGNDLNRQFTTPKDILHPNIIALKELVREIMSTDKEVSAYIDFHGHSLKKNVFMYGAEFPVYNPNYYQVKILPKLLARRTSMFRFQSCTFTVSRPKMTTARAVFSMQYGISNFYTLEASYAMFVNASREFVLFDAAGFVEMGCAVAGAIYDYKKLLEEEELAAVKLKMKKGDLLKMNIQKLEKEKAEKPVVVNAIKVQLDVITEKTGNKTPSKPMSEAMTPNEGEKRKKKFRIKKTKEIELDMERVFSEDKPPKTSRNKNTPTNKSINGKRGESRGRETPKNFSFIPMKEFLKNPAPFNQLPATPSGGNTKIGLFSLLEEIKDSGNIRPEDRAESDSFSEGGSDSEASEDDFGADEMRRMQRNIVGCIDKFKDVCHNGDKYELIAQKNDRKRAKELKGNPQSVLVKSRKFNEISTYKVGEVLMAHTIKQSIRNIQSASEKVTSRSNQKKVRETTPENFPNPLQLKKKSQFLNKDIQIESPLTSATVEQMKNQVNSFYSGAFTGPKKEGSQKNNSDLPIRFQESRDSRTGSLNPYDMKSIEENHYLKGTDRIDEKKNFETLKPIHMNSLMEKQYQFNRTIKSPLEQVFRQNPRAHHLLCEKEEFEALDFASPEVVYLDRGFRTSLNFGKPQSLQNSNRKDGLLIDVDDFKESSFKPSGSKNKHFNSHSVNQPQREDTEQALEKSGNKGKVKLGGTFSQLHVTTAQIMSNKNRDGGPWMAVAPLKNQKKLPISFETYKKMLFLRKKTEDIKDRKKPQILFEK